MDRNEFLIALEQALKGELPDYEIPEHIQYYDNYLREQNGKTEEEKLIELGEPRLIARTIIEARNSKGAAEGNSSGTSYQGSYGQQNRSQEQNQQADYQIYSWENLKWYQKLLGVLLLMLVAVVVIGVAKIGLQIFFSFVLPILIAIVALKIIISIFQ